MHCLSLYSNVFSFVRDGALAFAYCVWPLPSWRLSEFFSLMLSDSFGTHIMLQATTVDINECVCLFIN